ncbi:cytochrome c oxidase assembly protein [Aurantimonas sp. A2-1-M11]|uniref:cytochrome c oxidase assembly protein n=1 Tax=Aurantimonas sp. A2-1-M11 TaxID=3113712 RepID=UPI002F937E00
MSEPHPNPAAGKPSSERRRVVIAVACGAFALGMVGAAYASVPLYELFCQVTGYGGTTQRAETAPSEVSDRTVLVRFDGNVAPGLHWKFGPNDREVTVRLGETRQTSFHVKNLSDQPVRAQATFNVTPVAAGVYFNKIACFCFDNQILQPGEEIDMPIVFYVDPEMIEAEELKNAPGITLSYTFFPLDEAGAPVTAQTGGQTETPKTDQL